MNQNDKKIINISLNTLKIEANALAMAKVAIDQSFCQIVNLIYTCKGRIIITGIGKSGIAAQKIVSTLNSTGTPSIFMHAADAIHGDLGMMKSEDIVIVLSKSGNSPEIKSLIPYIKRKGNITIGLTNNKDSILSQLSDHTIYVPLKEEADPNNLAPTASLITHIAIGDAIATSLIMLRKFQAKDFAEFHPGGQLGKELYLTVEHIFTKNESPAVKTTSSVREIILEISAKRLGATAVLDDRNQLVGVITDGDIRRMLTANDETKHLVAEDIMSPNPKFIEPSMLAYNALEIMKKHNITSLIVQNSNQYRGMIHLHDLLNEGFS